MSTSSRMFAAATLALGFLPLISAWYPCYPAPLTLAQLIGEPDCPAGQDAWHSYVEVYVPVGSISYFSINGP